MAQINSVRLPSGHVLKHVPDRYWARDRLVFPVTMQRHIETIRVGGAASLPPRYPFPGFFIPFIFHHTERLKLGEAWVFDQLSLRQPGIDFGLPCYVSLYVNGVKVCFWIPGATGKTELGKPITVNNEQEWGVTVTTARVGEDFDHPPHLCLAGLHLPPRYPEA